MIKDMIYYSILTKERKEDCGVLMKNLETGAGGRQQDFHFYLLV